jgi:rhodanese-related sulfurtransferase
MHSYANSRAQVGDRFRGVAREQSVAALLAEARSRIDRLTALEAFAAVRDGALLVDTRSADEQHEQGVVVPGAVHHPLSVVLWRLDDLPRDTRVILICRQGYSSSLAAARLRELGFRHAADVVDGIEGWREAGLPLEPAA